MTFKNLCCSNLSNVRQCIEIIDNGQVGYAFVLNETEQLVGIVTDGDVRRALLRGVQLQDLVTEVMNRDFKWAASPAEMHESKAFLRRKGLRYLPELDDEGRIVSIISNDELAVPYSEDCSVVIMAGGRGVRLGDLTKKCPKPMIEVNGRPIIDTVLQQCVDAGFREFYLSVNYLKDQIKDYFGNGNNRGISIQYIEEKEPLGTVGSLSLLPKAAKKPIFVLNADIVTKVDFGQILQFHRETGGRATACVSKKQVTVPFGVVEFSETRLLSVSEKPSFDYFALSGIYVLENEIVDLIEPKKRTDMPELLQAGIQSGAEVNIFPIHEYWLDVGLPQNLEEARNQNDR